MAVVGKDTTTNALTAQQIADLDSVIGGKANVAFGTRMGQRVYINMGLVGATIALTAAQSGAICNNNATSGSPKWTLPAAQQGLTFTFINTSTAVNTVINAADAATIRCKASATGATIVSTASTGTIILSTPVLGDCITFVCDGTNWQLVSQSCVCTQT